MYLFAILTILRKQNDSQLATPIAEIYARKKGALVLVRRQVDFDANKKMHSAKYNTTPRKYKVSYFLTHVNHCPSIGIHVCILT